MTGKRMKVRSEDESRVKSDTKELNRRRDDLTIISNILWFEPV